MLESTHAGKGGQPFNSEKEAYLSHYSSASGIYSDPYGTYRSERAQAEARWDREHR